MSALTVMGNGAAVGVLRRENHRWQFAYAQNWQSFPLSPHLPLDAGEIKDNDGHRPVEWFFDNLLPEGRLRELIARRDRTDPRDSWGMLKRHGHDTAGALSVIAGEPAAHEGIGSLRELKPSDLHVQIQNAKRNLRPLMASWDEIRMSLAGAQEKLGLQIHADGRLFLPEGSTASTHIVKPDNASTDFPFCPANEYFCMRLARALGISVPGVDLLHLPEPLYVIERFDRDPVCLPAGADGRAVRRIHQIDLCQMLGMPATLKYESEGGIGTGELFAILHSAHIARPILAIRAVLTWIAFNYLIGNLDAHAKNLAFLVTGPKASVAPFYDLLCVEAYLPRHTMAMSIDEENKPGWIEARHWDALAKEAGVGQRYVRGLLEGLHRDIPKHFEAILGDGKMTPPEHAFIRETVLPVIQERRQMIAEALGLSR